MTREHNTSTLGLITILALSISLSFAPAMLAREPDGAALDSEFAAEVNDLLGASYTLGVDWARLFEHHFGRVGPELRSLEGFDAVLLEDEISAGMALDLSVLGASGSLDMVVENGLVSPAHDLGNAYMYATLSSANELVLYTGIERLATAATTFIEIELNQDRVRVLSGIPWPLWGERKSNDLLIRLDFENGDPTTVELLRWRDAGDGDGAFESLAAYDGLETSSCSGESGSLLVCFGTPPLVAPREARNAAGVALEPVLPDSFVEVGVNVDRLLDVIVEFTSIQVRTPEDIVLGSFRTMGSWARAKQAK